MCPLLAGLSFEVEAIFYSTLFGAVLAVGVLVYHGSLGKGLKNSARRTVPTCTLGQARGQPVSPTATAASKSD